MAADPNQLAFNRLSQLIEFRKGIETRCILSEHSFHPTTVDFPDIDGCTLLRYAIRLGDLQKVKELIEAGADPANGLLWALVGNRLEIAEFMLGQGSDFAKIKLEWVQKEPCHTWFKNILIKHLNVIKGVKSAPLTLFSYLIPEEWLRRAAESGLADALRPHTLKEQICRYGNDKKLINELACLAAANNRVDVLKLLKQQDHDLTPHESWNNSALISAAKYKKIEAAAYLLNQGVDPNYIGEKKRNALMVAAEAQSPELTAMLLEAGADVLARDYHGQTALHISCKTPSPDSKVIHLLASAMQEINLHELYDIFGLTPLDYANNTGAIAFLTPSRDGYVDRMPVRSLQVISQKTILEKIEYFLKLSRRSLDFYNDGGHCNAFTWLHAFYIDNTKEDYYFDTLELLAGWDGTQGQLDAPFDPELPQAAYYRNLGEIFEQWCNDLIWFQDSHAVICKTYDNPEACNQLINQNNRNFQFEIAGNLPCKNLMISVEDIQVHAGQLQERIDIIINRYPRRTQIFISGSGHVVSLRINDDLTVDYYDCNFPHKLMPLKNTQSIIDLFIDTKYRLLKRGMSHNGNIYMTLQVVMYYFNKQEMHDYITGYESFSQEEIPCSEEEVCNFQERSPNKYTPLHIAVLSGSLKSVQNMLEKEVLLQQANKKNYHCKTPFEIALESANISIISAFIECSKNHKIALKLDLSLDHYLLNAWRQRKSDLFILLLNELPESARWRCFIEAIKCSYTELVYQFINEKWVDISENPDYDYRDDNVITMAVNLMYSAMCADNIELFRLFLERFPKEHLSRFCQDEKSDRTLLHWSIVNKKNEFLEALLQAGADVHVRTNEGDTCLHLMVKFKNPAYLSVFYQKGVDPFVENNNQETVQDLLMKCEDESLCSVFLDYWQNLSNLQSPVAMC
ncbi:ankyrin repeat domain-containing protein [Legionella sp. CNM-4043-24]|uniref:ankyrin repeat domain-containing protein n=1 Tax=Legionella sp. CNM-4043-24 TaxID=3421646 RepID=UPI00403AF72F